MSLLCSDKRRTKDEEEMGLSSLGGNALFL